MRSKFLKCDPILSLLGELGYFQGKAIYETHTAMKQAPLHLAYMMNSPNFKSFLSAVKTMLQFHGGSSYTSEVDGNSFFIFADNIKEKISSPFAVNGLQDIELYGVAQLIQNYTGLTQSDIEISFCQANFNHVPESNLLFSNIITNGKKRYIRIPLAAKEFHSNTGHPSVNEYLSNEFERLYEEKKSAPNFHLQVKDYIDSLMRTNSGHLVKIKDVTKKYNVSRTTLFRRLDECGVSYSTIVDESRKSLALELLSAKKFTVGEISDRLGYSNVTSFTKAFKRWYETNPSTILGL